MNNRFIRIALFLSIGWYVLLASAHFLNPRPLWNDEECVFASIKEYNSAQFFTQSLMHGQAFPRVYLWATKQFASVFNYHLLSLRFFSFVSMLAAFALWMFWAARRKEGRGWSLVIFALCWSASIPLVYYASELKPYSMDVLVAVIFLWALHWQGSWSKLSLNASMWWACALPLLGLFSYPAFFLMPFILYHLVLLSVKERRFLRLLWVYLGVFLGALVFVYFFDLRTSNAGILKTYWQDYFISFASIGEFFKTFGEGVNNLISRWFAETPKWVRGVSRVFMGLGFVYLIASSCKRLKEGNYFIGSTTTLGFVIFLELVVLAALRQYPFSVPRMELFFCPFLFLASVEALDWLYTKQKLAHTLITILFVLYLLYVSIGIGQVVLSSSLGAQSIIWATH